MIAEKDDTRHCNIVLNRKIQHGNIFLIDGWLTCLAGYEWNGSNGIVKNNRNKRASKFHDALYDLMKVEKLPKKYRKKADKLYLELLIENKTCKIWAYIQYISVRLFGWWSIK